MVPGYIFTRNQRQWITGALTAGRVAGHGGWPNQEDQAQAVDLAARERARYPRAYEQ